MSNRWPFPIVYVSPLDWWPPWQNVDQWRAAQVSTGEAPLYWTDARELAVQVWGENAGLKAEPLPHEVDDGQ